jgi:hypothetical protein
MTIADKHTGGPGARPDGDGKLTVDEAATLLGDASSNGGSRK